MQVKVIAVLGHIKIHLLLSFTVSGSFFLSHIPGSWQEVVMVTVFYALKYLLLMSSKEKVKHTITQVSII